MNKFYFLCLSLISGSIISQNIATQKPDAGFNEQAFIQKAIDKKIPVQDISGYVNAERCKYKQEHSGDAHKHTEKVTMVNMSRQSNQTVQTNYCSNSDFSMLNYSSWTGDISNSESAGTTYPIANWSSTGINGNNGSPVLMNTDPCNGINVATDRQIIMNMQIGAVTTNAALAFNNGYDPTCCNTNTLMYDLPMVPPGETTSIRLGSAYPNYTSQKLVYALSPSVAMSMFTYQFAVVINDGGHGVGEQPAFLLALKDSAGNILTSNTCFQYNIDATAATGDTSYIRNSAGNPCANSGSSQTLYRKWHTVGIDLTNYIGQTVFAEFQSLDCIYSGHFCYAYISAKCQSGAGHVSMCAGSTNQELFAPAGFANYQWYGPNNTNPIAGATYDTLSIQNGVIGDTYQVDCISLQGCTSKVNLVLQYTPLDILYYNSSFSGGITGGGNISMCNGNNINLVAQGASTYTWSTSAGSSNNDTVNVTPTLSSLTYSVSGTGTNGCVDTASISFTLDTTGCVWPGDADENLIVDNQDLLPVGVKWGVTGANRSYLSSLWYGYGCTDWNDTLQNGTNTKYVDCNGSGSIEYGDTLSVNVNYNSTHALRQSAPHSIQTVNPDIYLNFNKTLYYPGDTLYADVMLGKSSNQQVNFYGAAFTVDYDETKTKPNTEKFSYNNSWLGNVNVDFIKLAKIFPTTGYVDASIVRVTHTDVTGYGKIAQLQIILKDTLGGNGWIYFNINNTIKTNSQGETGTLSSGTDSVAIAMNIGIAQKNNAQHLSIYPNPSTGNFSINSSENIDEVKVTDILGNTLIVLKPGAQKTSVQLESEGVYFIEINSGKQHSVRKVVVSH